MIDQVRGRFHHALCAAAGAEPAPLATERHQVLVPRAVALHAQETVLQQPAPQVVPELPANKAGQVSARLFNRLYELCAMPGNNGIQSGGLWSMPAASG